jgi:hypothetical protein
MFSPDGNNLKYYHSTNKREPYVSCPNRGLRLDRDVVEQAVREDLLLVAVADTEDIVQNTPVDYKEDIERIAKAREKVAADMASARRLRTDGEFSKEDWLAEKDRLEAKDAYLHKEERRLDVQPQYYEFVSDEDLHEKAQFEFSGVDYFDTFEWFQLCDRWNGEVFIVEPANSPLKAVLKMFSNLISSDGPSARPRCSKQFVNC